MIKIEMKQLLLLLVTITASTVESNSRAQRLWESQMKALKNVVSEFNLPEDEPEPKATTRQIGLPFYGIDFENAPSDFMTVHTLRPQDIDTVAALGDSITAANGAEGETVDDIGIQYRSVCYSMGGRNTLEDSITLPNILKKFNPRVDGYSYENGPLVNQYPYGFNVAVPGARAFNMLRQSETLIDLLQTDDRSKYESDWKLVTLFIGGNDLCAIGRDPNGTTAEVYVAEIKKALDHLHATVPRMIVSIVDILEIYLLPQVSFGGAGSTDACRAAVSGFCGYVIGTKDDPEEQAKLIAINKEYQQQLKDLIDSGIYDTRDDFTVVIQPFLRDSVLPYTEDGQVDASYFAPDCFHFSDIGHAMAALNTWNNMLEPVGSKSTSWTIKDLKVPTEKNPYIFTRMNSVPQENLPEEDDDVDSDPSSSDSTPGWLIAVIVVLVVLVVAQGVVLVMARKRRHDKPIF